MEARLNPHNSSPAGARSFAEPYTMLVRWLQRDRGRRRPSRLHHAGGRAAGLRARLRGVPKSPEAIAKLALARTGSKASPETRAKMSAAQRQATFAGVGATTGNDAAGRPKSPEHRAKLSAARMGQKPSAETRAKLSAVWRLRRAKRAQEDSQRRLDYDHTADLAARAVVWCSAWSSG